MITATVGICTWNRAKLLDQTLAKFESLRVPAEVTWELLVVNNNCTDETDAVVQSYQGRLPVRLIHETTPGKVHALNRTIAEARGEFLFFTDDDALVEPDWLAEVLSAFRTHQADLVFGRVLPWWETEPPGWYDRVLDPNFALLDYGDAPFVAETMQRNPFGVNYAFRTRVFQEIGPFKTDLGPRGNAGFGGEDDEMFRRILMHKKKAVYHPAAVVRHYVPRVRCEKKYHRMRAWRGSADHLNLLRDEATVTPDLPRLFGVPRYFFRHNLGYITKYLGRLVRGDRPGTFFYELKLIRLGGLLWNLLRRRRVPA